VELWPLYDELCRAVLRAEAVFASLALPRDRCPMHAELIVVLEQAKAIASALADVLDGMNRARVEGPPVATSLEEVCAFLISDERTGPINLPDGRTAKLPWGTVIEKLHRFYGFHVRLDNHLHEREIPSLFAWQENMKLWQTFVYGDAITGGGELLARLAMFAAFSRLRDARPPAAPADLLAGRVTSFRRDQGFGVIRLEDGREVRFDAAQCTMVPTAGDAVRLRVGPARSGGGLKALHVEEPEVATVAPAPPPGERAWPWDDRDVRMLRGIAAHAAALAAAR